MLIGEKSIHHLITNITIMPRKSRSSNINNNSNKYKNKKAKKIKASKKLNEQDLLWKTELEKIILSCQTHTIFNKHILDPYKGNFETPDKDYRDRFQTHYETIRRECYAPKKVSTKLNRRLDELKMAYNMALLERRKAFTAIDSTLSIIAFKHTMTELLEQFKALTGIEDANLLKIYRKLLVKRIKQLGYTTKPEPKEKVIETVEVIDDLTEDEPTDELDDNVQESTIDTKELELLLKKRVEEEKQKRIVRIQRQKEWLVGYRNHLIASINDTLVDLFKGGLQSELEYTAYVKGQVTANELDALLASEKLLEKYLTAAQERTITYTQSLEYGKTCVSPKMLFDNVDNLSTKDKDKGTQKAVVQAIKNIAFDLDNLKSLLKSKQYEDYPLEQEALDTLSPISWNDITMPQTALVPDSIMTSPDTTGAKKEKAETMEAFKPNKIEFMNHLHLNKFLLDFPTAMITVGSSPDFRKKYEDAWYKYFINDGRMKKTVDRLILNIKSAKKKLKNDALITEIEKQTDALVELFQVTYGINILESGIHVECQKLLNSWINVIGKERWSKTKYALDYYDKFDFFAGSTALAKDLAGLKNAAKMLKAENNYLGDFKDMVDWGSLNSSLSNFCTASGVLAQAVDMGKDTYEAYEAIKSGDAPWYKKVPLVNGFITLVQEIRDAWDARKRYKKIINDLEIKLNPVSNSVLHEQRLLSEGNGSQQTLLKFQQQKETLLTRIHNYSRAAKKMIRLFFNKIIDFCAKVLNYLSWVLTLIPIGVTQAVASAIGAINGLMGFCQKTRMLANNLWKRMRGTLGKSRTEAAQNIVGDIYNTTVDDVSTLLKDEAYETLDKCGILENKVVKELLTTQKEANPQFRSKDETPNIPPLLEHPMPWGDMGKFKACMNYLIGNQDLDTARFLTVRAYMQEHLKQALKSN